MMSRCRRVASWLAVSCACVGSVAASESAPNDPPDRLIVVVGAPGASRYRADFAAWSDRLADSARQSGMAVTVIGRDESKQSGDQLREAIAEARATENETLWLVMIGHGTFYDGEAKFNLVGPDVSADQMRGWLQPLSRRVVIVNTASASGPFIERLSGPGRVVVAATKSGTEANATVFGDFFTQSLTNADADLDHDDEVSVLEAFRFTVAGVNRFYESADRIVTEHALIDDNGDGQGTRFETFSTSAGATPPDESAAVDGRFARRVIWPSAHDRIAWTPLESERRDELELALEQLKSQKSSLSEVHYREQLEAILVPLAELYRDK